MVKQRTSWGFTLATTAETGTP